RKGRDTAACRPSPPLTCLPMPPIMKQKSDAHLKSKFPLFVHAWFRSGSTYIWSKLRNNEKLICYYEPFHEVLAEETLLEQIENHRPTEAGVALRHPVLARHYFYEYTKLLEEHRLNFVP